MGNRYYDVARLKRWQVRDGDDILHEIEAHYCFDNSDDGRGLVFRRHHNDDHENRTFVVASFANGFWKFHKEVDRDE